MSSCINTSAAEFRSLQERSGLSDFQLRVAVRAYLMEHPEGWPKLDEIPNANSEESLRQALDVKKDGSTKVLKILDATQTNSVLEANIFINNLHRDLNTTILPILEDAIVTIERRPSIYRLSKGEARDYSNVCSPIFIALSLENLANNFGIQTIYKNTKELKAEGVLDLVPEGVGVSAFILNGNVIVNLDVASVDAPTHELMHVLMGSLRFTQPDLYYNLVLSARLLPIYAERAALYPHRAQSDIDEEVFVEEYAKYISGLPNEFRNLDPEILYQLDYEITRTLDTILNGDNSVRMIPAATRFGTSLRNLGIMVNSKNMEPKNVCFAESAFLSRVLGNIKSDLFKLNKLEEIC